MLKCFIEKAEHAVPIIFIAESHFQKFLETQSSFCKNWIASQKFTAKPDTFCIIPSEKGQSEKVIVGQGTPANHFYSGHLANALPQGIYTLEPFHPLAALSFGMGAYQFTRYKTPTKTPSQLILPKEHEDIAAKLKAIYLVRDLINTPTEEMGPPQLAEQAERIAKEFGAEFNQIIGDDLLTHRYPAIHAVGRASTRPPRLIDLRWGEKNAPKVTLVGKGVCFDTGGLDLKTSQGMLTMKKDMAGAAHVLGLAYLIMYFKLPVRLRVLIPAVENAVSGNAYRPGDVIPSRKGLSIEIGNTDAEGRVILSDALFEASSEQPDLLIDFATLTGAARIAMGPELGALFSNDDKLARDLIRISQEIGDPLWHMPLYQPYRKLIDSQIADINNNANTSYGGAITAALFLKEFISEKISWAHFDIMAWNAPASPSHPEGGEAMGLRAVFEYLQERFGK